MPILPTFSYKKHNCQTKVYYGINDIIKLHFYANNYGRELLIIIIFPIMSMD